MNVKDSSAEGGLNRAELIRNSAAGVVGLGVLGLIGCGDDDSGSSSSAGGDKPPSAPTGLVRVGYVSSGPDIIADPRTGPLGSAGGARLFMLHDALAYMFDGKVTLQLAESIEPASDDATIWDVTLRDGVKFSDGKPLRPEDLIETIRLYQAPDSSMASRWSGVKSAVKTGASTVRITLNDPDATFASTYALESWVLPEGYDPKKPVGSGPFTLESIDPGRKTVMKANPNYWGNGPYAETLEIHEFADDSARVNALQARQIDVTDSLSLSQVKTLQGSSGINVQTTDSGGGPMLVMNTEAEPFDDVRVRQAFRLLINRQSVTEQIFGDTATVANDLTAPFDTAYAGDDLTQREQDIERAKQLLKDAGHENLTVTLNASEIGFSAIDLAQVFVEHAKEGGVTVKLRKIDPAVYWTPDGPEGGYGSYPFSVSFTDSSQGPSYLGYVKLSLDPKSAYNETHFSDPEFSRLNTDALATADEAKRNALIAEMQRIEYETGGYILAAFIGSNLAYQSTVKGIKPLKGTGINSGRLDTIWS